MKYNELYRELRKAGCFVVRHGGDHDIWYSPITGLTESIPRHGSREASIGIVRRAYKNLLGR